MLTSTITRHLVRERAVRQLTSSGKQGLAGASGTFTTVEHGASATVGHNTQNTVLADDVVLTIPTPLVNGEPFKFIVPQAYTGFAINGGGATVDGENGDVGFNTPCALTLVYLESESNLFIESSNYGQRPAA